MTGVTAHTVKENRVRVGLCLMITWLTPILCCRSVQMKLTKDAEIVAHKANSGIGGKPMPLTHEEHHTRAMLLGMSYRPHFNAYRGDTSKESGYIDADTLEPVSSEELLERIKDTMPGTPDPKHPAGKQFIIHWADMNADRARG